MSNLKEYVQSYKTCCHKFVPFMPADNNVLDLDSTKVINHNLEGMNYLLKNNILVFICEIVCNTTLHQFIESYLLTRQKPYITGSPKPLLVLDQKVFLLFQRMYSTEEIDSLDKLLPTPTLTVINPKSKAGLTNLNNNEDSASKHSQMSFDQYQALIASVPFAKLPCVIDLIAIIGDSNAQLSGKLLQGMNHLRAATTSSSSSSTGGSSSSSGGNSSSKDCNDAMKESIKALQQVHLSVIIISRRLLGTKQQQGIKITGKNSTSITGSSKVSGLSVLSTDKRILTQEKASKQTSTEELAFLVEFVVDIVYTLHTVLLAVNSTELPYSFTGVLCLEGTHLSGTVGLPLLRCLQNLYEVLLPLFTRCISTIEKSAAVDTQKLCKLLHILQYITLKMLDTQLNTSINAMNTLYSIENRSNKTTTTSTSAGTMSDHFDSMDVLREDGIDWIAFLQGQDPLGRDALVLTANTANIGETASNKLLTTAGNISSTKSTITTAGVVHIVDEAEVLRGAFLTDYMKIYGSKSIETIVRCSLGKEADTERVQYILTSLQTTESLLSRPIAPLPTSIEVPKLDTLTISPASGASAEDTAPQLDQAEMVANIKSIFPDLGEGFIEACIAVYKGNMDEIVDALLTNNLQPKLLMLDRTLKKVWVGKGGAGSQETVSLDAKKRDASVVYKAVDDKEFKAAQLERVRRMEAQQEYDHMLLSREYNDDYDDQYDDQVVDVLKVQSYSGNGGQERFADPSTSTPTNIKPTAPAPTPEPVILNRRDRRKNKAQLDATGATTSTATTAVSSQASKPTAPSHMTTAMVHQQMAEMKRLNALTREAEVEDSYWESMRNTNRSSTATSGKGSWKAELQRQEEEIAAAGLPDPPVKSTGNARRPTTATTANSTTGATTTSSKPKPTQNNTSGNKPDTLSGRPQQQQKSNETNKVNPEAGGSTNEDKPKKHRTKPYDKHHQKDRSTRKFSHFAPQT